MSKHAQFQSSNDLSAYLPNFPCLKYQSKQPSTVSFFVLLKLNSTNFVYTWRTKKRPYKNKNKKPHKIPNTEWQTNQFKPF